MRLALSNLALPPFDHIHLLPRLPALGISGIEVAPDHTWPVARGGFCPGHVSRYRRAAESSGLHTVGLHALLGGRPELGLFEDVETRRHTIDHLAHLSAVCRDLGGRTLILDSRWRRELPRKDAWMTARGLLEAVLARIEDHGTMLCLAPLSSQEGDFCNSAHDCLMMVQAIDNPCFGVHLGAKALAMNGETGHATFAAVRGCLQHVHVDDLDGAVPGSTGLIDHVDVRCHLAAIAYRGWISIVHHRGSRRDPMEAVTRGVTFVADHYVDKRSVAGRETAAEHERFRLISETIETLRPAIQDDGGDLELVAVEGHRVKVRLSGRCVSCAMAGQTLGGIRRQLIKVLKTPVMVVPSDPRGD